MTSAGTSTLQLLDGKLTFAGFIDCCRGEKANRHGQLVVLSEPQLWYNFDKHFSVGTEMEFSNNFVLNQVASSDQHFFWNPTLGVKWSF